MLSFQFNASADDYALSTHEIFSALQEAKSSPQLRTKKPPQKEFCATDVLKLKMENPNDIFDIGCSLNNRECQENLPAFVSFISTLIKGNESKRKLRLWLAGTLQALTKKFEKEFENTLKIRLAALSSLKEYTYKSKTHEEINEESKREAEKLEEDTFKEMLKHCFKLRLTQDSNFEISALGFTEVINKNVANLQKNKKNYGSVRSLKDIPKEISVAQEAERKQEEKKKAKSKPKRSVLRSPKDISKEINVAQGVERKQEEKKKVKSKPKAAIEKAINYLLTGAKDLPENHPVIVLFSWMHLTGNLGQEYVIAQEELQQLLTENKYIKDKFNEFLVANMGMARLKHQYLSCFKHQSQFKLSDSELFAYYNDFKKDHENSKLFLELEGITADVLSGANIQSIVEILAEHNYLGLLDSSKKTCEQYLLTEIPVFIKMARQAKLHNLKTGGVVYFGYPISHGSIGEAFLHFIFNEIFPLIPGLADCGEYFKIVDIRKLMKKFIDSPVKQTQFSWIDSFEDSWINWSIDSFRKPSQFVDFASEKSCQVTPDTEAYSDDSLSRAFAFKSRACMFSNPTLPVAAAAVVPGCAVEAAAEKDDEDDFLTLNQSLGKAF